LRRPKMSPMEAQARDPKRAPSVHVATMVPLLLC
jgi:hypothetical protein